MATNYPNPERKGIQSIFKIFDIKLLGIIDGQNLQNID